MNMFQPEPPLPPGSVPYPRNRFPYRLCQLSMEIQRNVQLPDGLGDMAMIGGMAIACQGLVDVKLPNGQVRPTSLFLLSVAESGDRKTTVDNIVLAPLYEHDFQAALNFKRRLEEYQVELDEWVDDLKEIRGRKHKAKTYGDSLEEIQKELMTHRRAKPKSPKHTRFMVQDITPRALMERLEGDGVSTMICTDEGEVIFRSQTMSSLGRANKLWDGTKWMPLDRADMESVLVSNPRLTLHIMTQPKVLADYQARHGEIARGSGHWARYLVGYPYSIQGYREVFPGEMQWEHLPWFHGRMRELLYQYRAIAEMGNIEHQVLEFTDDAKMRWFNLQWETEYSLRPGFYLGDIRDYGAKLGEIVGRLSAVIHHFNGEQGAITLDTLERAVSILAWHVEAFRVMFSPEHKPMEEEVDAKKLMEWLVAHRAWVASAGGFVAKNFLRRNVIRNSSRLNAALARLASWNTLQIVQAQGKKQWWIQLLPGFDIISM